MPKKQRQESRKSVVPAAELLMWKKNHGLGRIGRSEGIIFVVVFCKIHCFAFSGDSLGGIVTEAVTFTIQWANPFFGTQNLRIIQLCPKGAIRAGTFDFFAEQHSEPHFVLR